MQCLVRLGGRDLLPLKERESIYRHQWLISLRAQLAIHKDSVIYLPISLHNKHWIVARLDTNRRKWSFADSSANLPISTVYYQALLFLSETLGLPCMEKIPPPSNTTFCSGRQVDGHSCGYFALNSMEVDIFGHCDAVPLGTQSTAKLLRLRAFLLIYQENLQSHDFTIDPQDKGFSQLDQFPSHARNLVNMSSQSSYHSAATEDSSPVVPRTPFSSSRASSAGFREKDEDTTGDISSDSSDNGYEFPAFSDNTSDSDWSIYTDDEYLDFDYSDAAIEARYRRKLSQTPQPGGSSTPAKLRKVDTTGSKKRMDKLTRRRLDFEKVQNNLHLWQRFQKRIAAICVDARTDMNLYPRHVWCPQCSDWFPLREVFQSADFQSHYAECKSKNSVAKASSQVSVKNFFSAIPKKSSNRFTNKMSLDNNSGLLEQSCPGLTKCFDPRIDRYLERTGADGGGAPPYQKLHQRVKMTHPRKRDVKRSLRKANKGGFYTKSDQAREIRLLEARLYKWINHRTLKLVRSRECTGISNAKGSPCEPCRALKKLKVFKNALSRKTSPEDKLKYTPHRFVEGFLHNLTIKYKGLDKLIDETGTESFMLRLAKMIHEDEGENNCYAVFRGMCEAVYHTEERKKRGLGTQGLVRNQAFVNTMHSLALMSPLAYRKLSKLFAGPTIRHLR